MVIGQLDRVIDVGLPKRHWLCSAVLFCAQSGNWALIHYPHSLLRPSSAHASLSLLLALCCPVLPSPARSCPVPPGPARSSELALASRSKSGCCLPSFITEDSVPPGEFESPSPP